MAKLLLKINWSASKNEKLTNRCMVHHSFWFWHNQYLKILDELKIKLNKIKSDKSIKFVLKLKWLLNIYQI